MKIVIKSSIILPLKHLHLPESLELPLPVHRLANWNVTRRSLNWSRDWVGSAPAQQLTDKIYKSLWNTITWHTYLQSISSTACPSSGITPISISIVYKINSSPQRCCCRFYSIYHFLDNCHWIHSIKFELNLVEYELWLVLINKLPSNAVIFTPSPVKTTFSRWQCFFYLKFEVCRSRSNTQKLRGRIFSLLAENDFL